jgi:hypothetical protein
MLGATISINPRDALAPSQEGGRVPSMTDGLVYQAGHPTL